MSLLQLKKSIKNSADKEQSKILQRFFKTGRGEYGAGVIFLGIKVPVLRKIVKKNLDLTMKDLNEIINSPIHEERMAALMILVQRFPKSNEAEKEKIFRFYLKNTRYINNWDLVDLSAPQIIGGYLIDKDKNILKKLALSENLWERRIAMLSTFQFIKSNQYDIAILIAGKLLNDKHYLIQKAVGWMLREIGKRNILIEENFLLPRYKKMPRTMLRYAIEKFPDEKRIAYLKGTI